MVRTCFERSSKSLGREKDRDSTINIYIQFVDIILKDGRAILIQLVFQRSKMIVELIYNVKKDQLLKVK